MTVPGTDLYICNSHSFVHANINIPAVLSLMNKFCALVLSHRHLFSATVSYSHRDCGLASLLGVVGSVRLATRRSGVRKLRPLPSVWQLEERLVVIMASRIVAKRQLLCD